MKQRDVRPNTSKSTRAHITLLVDQNLIRKARDLGLNISRTCELALKDRIDLMEQIKPQKEGFLDSTSFPKEGDWCGCRDLNPGHQRGRLKS